MRRRQAGALAVLIAALGWMGAAAATAEDSGFVPLFDGQTLDGWRRFGGKAETWRVEDGRLVCLGEGGGWLGTDRPYADFTLRLEFRLSPGSNSGIYLRAPADTSHISRTGMEIQLIDDDHPRYKNLKPWQYTGALYHVAAPERGHLKPAGHWNAMEIHLKGTHLVVRLNGAIVVDDRLDQHPELEKEHPGLKRTSGLIGLQCHNGRVEFRKLRIKEEK
ncbi:MAG: DUF1080 domain-containing protein [Isosphaeraceae bacterium]|nr:DUF1080 domain-containing protein [Isosphaeraceae bacterium]